MTTLWSRDREIQEIARKVPDPLSMKAGSGNETNFKWPATGEALFPGLDLDSGLDWTLDWTHRLWLNSALEHSD